MPILNYTTKIDSNKSIMEIQSKLAQSGAKSVIIDYDEHRQPEALTFAIEISGNWVSFRLPTNFNGVLKLLQEDPKVPKGFKTEEQARRVAWRITKDWVEAQLAFIDAKQAELAEVFLPYVVTDSGETLYQEFKKPKKQLASGEDSVLMGLLEDSSERV